MRKIILVLSCCLLLAGCGNRKTINGVTYDVFGLLNLEDKRNPNIEYELSIGSILVAAVFSETIVVPLYVLAVDLWQPVGLKLAVPGQVVLN